MTAQNPTPFDNSIKVKNLATEGGATPDIAVFDSNKILKKISWATLPEWDIQKVLGAGFSAVSSDTNSEVYFDLEGGTIYNKVFNSIFFAESGGISMSLNDDRFFIGGGGPAIERYNGSFLTRFQFTTPTVSSEVNVPAPVVADTYYMPLIINGETANAQGELTLPGGSGSVTQFNFTNANGVTGSVTDATTTPTLVLSLGAITPTTVSASGNISGANLSGTNTGDQTITLTSDVTGSGTGSFATTISTGAVTSSKILDGTILDTDINSSAGIDASKLADGSVSTTEYQYINSLTSNAQTQLNAKVPENTVVDYSATSTVVGWSSFTTKSIQYLTVGKATHVWLYIEGVSNSTTVSLTIPSNHTGANNYQSGGYSLNNSASLTTAPRIELVNGSNVVNISRIMTGGTWTASGNKAVSGYFVYQN
ncbi:hypothetical protein [Flavobacterium sp.]